MDLPDTLLDETWYWAAWAVWIPVFVWCLWRAPWSGLKDSSRSNLWLGMIVLLTLLWSLKAGVKPGLTLHLLGATAFTLCAGPYLAFVGLTVVLAGVTLNGAGGWLSFALNSLLMAGVGVIASWAIWRAAERWLPKNFFIYVFINAFFGAALTVLIVGACIAALLAWAGAYSFGYMWDEYLPYFLLLGFSEAWLSGMLLTLFVVYKPQWVATFDDALYLADK